MLFPKAVFGKKERSFNANWYSKFPWLHYDIKSDSVYCYSRMTAHTKGHKAVSGNSDLDHQNSVIHKDYEGLLQLDETNFDVDE